MISIIISRDFSETPGGRYIKEGAFSGEAFRKEILRPKYDEAIEKDEKLFIDFDNCYGFASSFLEESFGGLVRDTKSVKIKDILEIKSEDRDDIKDWIYKYIDKAAKEI